MLVCRTRLRRLRLDPLLVVLDQLVDGIQGFGLLTSLDTRHDSLAGRAIEHRLARHGVIELCELSQQPIHFDRVVDLSLGPVQELDHN